MTVRNTLAAIFFGPEDGVDEVLERLVADLKIRGFGVAGCLQRELAEEGCCSLNHIENIADGRRILISQPLGTGSRGCRLDPRGLAEASALLMRGLDDLPDILVINRFGKGEADGQGLRSVIEKAFGLGIPVLTAVRKLYLPAWTEFSGEPSTLLRPDVAQALNWCNQALRRGVCRASA